MGCCCFPVDLFVVALANYDIQGYLDTVEIFLSHFFMLPMMMTQIMLNPPSLCRAVVTHLDILVALANHDDNDDVGKLLHCRVVLCCYPS